MSNFTPDNIYEQTPFEYTLSIIGGKWTMRTLYQREDCHLMPVLNSMCDWGTAHRSEKIYKDKDYIL